MQIRLPKHPAWTCSCRTTIPKKEAQLSGDPYSHNGIHVHCPQCGKVIAKFINPKETQ